MSHPEEMDRSAAAALQKQLNSDQFIQMLGSTTLFRGIPPSQLPLPILETISEAAEVFTLFKSQALEIEIDEAGNAAVYEILSGFVKIYDRKPLTPEEEKVPVTNLPALLAWRVPGELLGDFQFAVPQEKLTDHIVATDECRLLKIPGAVITKVAIGAPQLYLNIAANLAIKAIKARIRAQILRLPNIECMVARLFIELLQERNIGQGQGPRLVNGTFRVDDIAAFLGYEYHRTQIGIRKLIREGLLKHHESKKSGRFEIKDEDGLHQYLAVELAKAAELRKQKGRRGSN